jgi:hypothetical protein
MTQPKPPALASWMLEHLLSGGKNEALAGDLLEEFRQRRSVAWYWRQVFGAILASFSNEIRADWVTVWTIVFSIVWVYGLYAIPAVGSPRSMSLDLALKANHYLAAHGYYRTHVWYAVGYLFWYGVPILFQMAIPLCAYLAGVRNLNLRNFARGICAAVPAMLVLRYLPGQGVLDFLVLHGLAYYWVQLWKWYGVTLEVIPLLAAMWAAQYRRKVSQSGVVAS